MENYNNNTFLKRLIYGLFGCKILGHSWYAPSTVPCIHECGMCLRKEKWCKQFKTIKGSAEEGWEQNKCVHCGKLESLVGGSTC